MHFYADHDNDDDDNNNDIGVCLLSLSAVSDSFATPRTIAHQPPLSLGFPRQESWSGLPFPTLGDLPDAGIKPASPGSPTFQVDSLRLSHQGSP